MLMRKIFIYILSFFVISVYADTALCLHQKDGKILKILLSSQPEISYNIDSVFIKTNHETISYLVSDFRKFTFEEVSDELTTGLVLVQTRKSQNTSMYYDLSGNRIMNLSTAKNGIYIIKNQTSAVKIFKHN